MTDDKMRLAFGAFWATQRQAFDPTWAPSFVGELREMAEDAWAAAIKEQAQEIEALRADAKSKQAEIDRLMQESCPDEMDAKQEASWAEHQVAASGDIEAAIAAAMKEDHDRP